MEEYFTNQKKNLEKNRNFEPFSILAPQVQNLYEKSLYLLPETVDDFFDRIILVCYQSFLSAMSLIGQGQPQDAAPITRRAIEACRIAEAYKMESASIEDWIAYEEINERWRLRIIGEKPDKKIYFSPRPKHPLLIELMDIWGVYSDAHIHFTPEYFKSLNWRQKNKHSFLIYFQTDNKTLAREIITTTSVHLKILQFIDELLDLSLSANKVWKTIANKLINDEEKISKKYLL